MILRKYPDKKQIKSEISNSFLTMFVFSLFFPFIPISSLSSDYEVTSIISHFIFLVVVHDTYFYWVHRLMHHRLFFPLVHKTHHKSICINPLSSYSFDIGESFLHGIFLNLYLFFTLVPIQTLILFVFFTFIANVQAHLGHEFFPKWWSSLNISCTSTHHYLHHRDFHYNYGFYFPTGIKSWVVNTQSIMMFLWIILVREVYLRSLIRRNKKI